VKEFEERIRAAEEGGRVGRPREEQIKKEKERLENK
jgi:hypothetical protein